MNIKDEIKSIIIKNGYTMSQVVELLNNKHNRKDMVQNFSNKLTRGTLKYREALEIAEILDYEIIWKPKNE